MYKVLRSYSKKAERKHELTRSNQLNSTSNACSYGRGAENLHGMNADLLVPYNDHHNQQQLQNLESTKWNGGKSATTGATSLGIHGAFSESSSYEAREHFERKVKRVKKTRAERDSMRKSHKTKACELSSANIDLLSAKDALLQWAQDVTRGYPGVNIRNFSSSWRDGLAFNAILHRYRPNIINWSKVSDETTTVRDRLNNAFTAAEAEFGVSRLLDAEDVDLETPDEKSIITYVSSLYNALPHSTLVNKGSLADMLSRLTRGIGITNEKLDHILQRIEDAETKVETSRSIDLQQTIDGIIDDLLLLESPILEFFDDVEQLRQFRHPEANSFYQQVYGLEQRRQSYMTRLRTQFMTKLGNRSETILRESVERRETIRRSTFSRVEECIEWVRVRLDKLSEMEFDHALRELESMFEEHKVDNHDIQDFRQKVDECIARQAEVAAEDSHEYCELLTTLESEYQQLRDLSAGRMLDLDTLIAFIRGVELELVWIKERQDIEITRNWSDINRLDLPMLQNYYKQLLHEIELREPIFNDVHNKGAALVNQGHPANHIIEYYLRDMQRNWDYLLALSRCLEQHLRDANNLKTFMEDAAAAEEWMQKQGELLERKYSRSDFSLEEGEQMLRELNEINEILKKYHAVLMHLTERSCEISPLWQRGERVEQPISVTAIANNFIVEEGDECMLVDNSRQHSWVLQDTSGSDFTDYSVFYRIPPPDSRLTSYISRLRANFDKLRRLWEKKNRLVRINMVLNTMKQIRNWNLDTFASIPPDERGAIIKACNDDVQKLLDELDPNDPLAVRLQEELKLVNEHFLDLLNRLNRPKEPEVSRFDEEVAKLLKKLNEANRSLNDRVAQGVPRSLSDLERLISEHKNFEEILQGMDVDVSTIHELFRQIPNPTPTQRANHDLLNGLWEDVWELSRMYVERLKALEGVLNGISEVSDIVRQHEITLNSYDDLSASLDSLRGVHSQLLEMNMVLQQQQSIIDSLNRNIALLRQHASRTRQSSSHPDVDRLEDEIQNLTVRWENVCSQVTERMKSTERALQTMMVYRPEYDNELTWLIKVEETINNLRRPGDLHPEQYQQQLDQLVADYAQLQERTEAIENVNREGGKFIREGKSYDSRLSQYADNIVSVHGPVIRNEFRRSYSQPKNGVQQVTEELERLNRRFAQLSSLILERRNVVQVLIQNWKRKKQEEMHEECVKRQAYMSDMLGTLNEITSAVSQRFCFVSSSDDANLAHGRMQNVREELLSWSSKVEESIEEADRLCLEGADLLTPQQFHTLKEQRNRLESIYNQMLRHTDTIIQCLNELAKLLLEFTNQCSEMHTFISNKMRQSKAIKAESGDLAQYEKAVHKAECLLNEVAMNQSGIKEVSQLSSCIKDKLGEYFIAMRVQYPDTQFASIDTHELMNTLANLQKEYDILMQSCHELISFLNRIRALSTACANVAERAEASMTGIERRLSVLEVGMHNYYEGIDNSSILRDLDELRQESVNQLGLSECYSQSAFELDCSLAGTDARQRIVLENRQKLDELTRRQERIKTRIEEDINLLRKKLAKTEGLRESVLGVKQWLETEQSRLTGFSSLPLSAEKLNDVLRQDELRLRELSSRESMLNDLAEELVQLSVSHSNETYQTLVDECSHSKQKIFSLIAISKARAENTMGLLTVLRNFTDEKKRLIDKLCELHDKLTNISTMDTDLFNEIQSQFFTVCNNDWPEIQKRCGWIMNFPNLEEGNLDCLNLTKIKATIQKVESRLSELTEMQRDFNEQKKTLERLKIDISSWIAKLENEIKGFAKLSPNPLDLDQQRCICDGLIADHLSHRSDIEKVDDCAIKLADMEAVVRCKLRQPSERSKDAVNSILRDIFEMKLKYDELGIMLKIRLEKINSTNEKFLDWDLTRADLCHWTKRERERLETECLVAACIDLVSINISKAKELEQIYLKEKNPLMESVRSKANSLINDFDLVELHIVENSLADIEKLWSSLYEKIESVKKLSVEAKYLIEGGDILEKWLKQKERMVTTIRAINVDTRVIDSQILQMEVLQGEIDDQSSERDKLNEIAHSLVISSSSDPNVSEIVSRMDDLNRRWLSLQDNVNLLRENLEKIKLTGAEFSAIHRAARLEVLQIQEDLQTECHNAYNNPDENDQRHIEVLDELLARLKKIDESVTMLMNISEAVKGMSEDAVLLCQLDEKVLSIQQASHELTIRIDSLKNANLNSKAEKGATMDEIESTLKWYKEKRDHLLELGPIPTDSVSLSKQLTEINQVYDEILCKESDVSLLRARVSDQLKRMPNPALKCAIESVSSEWYPLLESVKCKKTNVERASELIAQISSLFESINVKFCEQESGLQKLSGGKEININEYRELEQHVEKRHTELVALEALGQKLCDFASGPPANKIKRDIQNCVDDWNTLLKNIRNSMLKAQKQKECVSRYEKCKEDLASLLISTKENYETLSLDNRCSRLTKDCLTRALIDLESNWAVKNRELIAAAKKFPSSDGDFDKHTHDELEQEYCRLVEYLQKQLNEIAMNDEVIDHFKVDVQALYKDVRKLSYDEPKPISRNKQDLHQQKEDCDEFLRILDSKELECESLRKKWRGLCDIFPAHSVENSAVFSHLEDIKEDVNKYRAFLMERRRQISSMQQTLLNNQRDIDSVHEELSELLTDDLPHESIKSDINGLRNQQENIRCLREKLKPTAHRVREIVESCENLLKSADKNLDTSHLESEKNSLTDCWEDFNRRVEEREKQICLAMQKIGSYTDTYNSLITWLQEMEGSLVYLRPPSIEYKVVEEQWRANEIFLKLIEDKLQNINGFKELIGMVTATADEVEEKLLREKSENIATRYEQVVEFAHQRKNLLQDALDLTEKWSQLSNPLKIWLDSATKSLNQLGKVPTDEVQLHEQLISQKTLLNEIDAKAVNFNHVAVLCPQLGVLVSVDEAVELKTAAEHLLSQYEDIYARTNDCGILLQELVEEVCKFSNNMSSLSDWLDTIEDTIEKFGEIGMYPEELIEQSSRLAEVAVAVTEQESLVSAVVVDGRELCRQTTGDQAIALQSRIELLRARYTEIAMILESRIGILSEALPLSEQFYDGYEAIQQWLDAVEQDLIDLDQVPLEVQSSLISQMEDGFAKWRLEVKEIKGISKQLHRLRNGANSFAIEVQSDDLSRRFGQLGEQVTCKAEKLHSAERQCRQVLDELDYLNEWFTDVRERLMQASAPSIDPDYVKKQLKNQKQMNDDIAVMKARLRDAAADAQKLARTLGDEVAGQTSLLASKIESGRNLSADASRMGEDRLAELEQALALCQEVDHSYGELHNWLERMEDEIDSCPVISTGNRRDQLMEQQNHNEGLQQQLHSQKPLLDRFLKDFSALKDLCDACDGAQLEKVAEAIEERYEAIKQAVKQRSLALENAIEHNSQFSDRVNMIQSYFGAIANQLSNADPASVDPERIKSQILENSAMLEDLQNKEVALISLREQANEIIAQLKMGDVSIADVDEKVRNLDQLWTELNESLCNHGNLLEEALTKSEHFWAELKKSQKKVDDLRCALESIQSVIGQPSQIEQQQGALLSIKNEINESRPVFLENLRSSGNKLSQCVGTDERTHIQQELSAAECSWATIIDLSSRKCADLSDAMEKAMECHVLFAELRDYLLILEEGAACLISANGTDQNDIQEESAAVLNELRSKLDAKALQREQLNQLCASLCVGTQANQALLIRAPLNDLNNRWNRLHSLLNERQQKMERALLEVGQFLQAYDQLMKWIDKTQAVLEEIDSHPANLKQAEIEVCKHKVLHNDILAHEGNIDALNMAAKRIMADDASSASVMQPKLDALNSLWHTLIDKLDEVWDRLNEFQRAAANLGDEIDRWFLWLQDKDADLLHVKAYGGLPETAAAQIDDFLVLKAEIEQNRADLEAHIENFEKHLSEDSGNESSWVAQRESQIKKKWVSIQEKIADREQKLRVALIDAQQLNNSMMALNEWLSLAELRLGKLSPASRIPDTIEEQMSDQSSFLAEISVNREVMSDTHSRGTKLQYYCEKKDAIPIKNHMVSVKHRFDKVISRSTSRTKQLYAAYEEARSFFDAYHNLMKWIEESSQWINEPVVQAFSGDRIRDALDENRCFQKDLTSRQPVYDSTLKKGKCLFEHAPPPEKSIIGDCIENLKNKWSQLCSSSIKRLHDIEEVLLASGKFDEALSSLKEWLEKELPMAFEREKISVRGDIETVNQLFDVHTALCKQIECRQPSMESVKQSAEQVLNCNDKSDPSLENLNVRLRKLSDDWNELRILCEKRGERLKEAIIEAKKFDSDVQSILETIPRIESRIRTKNNAVENENDILELLDEIAQMRVLLDEQQPRLESVIATAVKIEQDCHPNAEQAMKYWCGVLRARWEEVSQSVEWKRDDLEKLLNQMRVQEKLIADLMEFINRKDTELKVSNSETLANNLDGINRLISGHENFEISLRQRQSDIDDVIKAKRKKEGDFKTISNTASWRDRSTRDRKSEYLSDRWKKLWVDSMDYGKRLGEVKEYLEEVKKLENFSFEEWRERYLIWTDSGKSRISDLFRRIDKSGTGRVPRAAFIDGIIASKFPTTRLEMQKVADEFDKGDGMIDSKEFMAKLRSDYSKKIPMKQKTDVEKISEEVTRQSEQCNCSSPYKIQKVGEGHYRFGDTQIKRMVRILRSTVMVRVGGGWVALDEFLHKHDPCRAKGRTNTYLQRGFYDDVRPKDAFDTMETFTKSNRSTSYREGNLSSFTDSMLSNRYSPTSGPITKIREKTERSMPMHNTKRLVTITPQSSRRLSNTIDAHPKKSNSRPSTSRDLSRLESQCDMLDASRPGSRCSDISEAVDFPTRIPSLRRKKELDVLVAVEKNVTMG